MVATVGITVLTPEDLGLRVTVDETGATFAENAVLKAETFRDASGLACLADDSGLVIDALGGDPGVYTARYGGPDLDDAGRMRLVLQRLFHVSEGNRMARFVATVAVAAPHCETRVFEGVVEGYIAREARGTHGFGYDPIFFYPPYGRTLADVTPTEKAAVSHRGKAVRAALTYVASRMSTAILDQSPGE
ncbi:MAG: RdgB/HAM1 family non-canonical purine NTP pyrophosphatase [Chloroflexota bacterium]